MNQNNQPPKYKRLKPLRKVQVNARITLADRDIIDRRATLHQASRGSMVAHILDEWCQQQGINDHESAKQ